MGKYEGFRHVDEPKSASSITEDANKIMKRRADQPIEELSRYGRIEAALTELNDNVDYTHELLHLLFGRIDTVLAPDYESTPGDEVGESMAGVPLNSQVWLRIANISDSVRIQQREIRMIMERIEI